MSFRSGFGRQSHITGQSVAVGFVTYQASIDVLLQYLRMPDRFVVSLRYRGTYESDAISIASLPSSGQWLRDKSISMACTGAGDITLAFTKVCDLPTQNISVSFQY
jgi:hypothetical protein